MDTVSTRVMDTVSAPGYLTPTCFFAKTGPAPFFEEAKLCERRARLSGWLKKEGFDAALLCSREDVHWATGHWTYGISPVALLVAPATNQWQLLVRYMESGNCPPLGADVFRICYFDTDDPREVFLQHVLKVLPERNERPRVGFAEADWLERSLIRRGIEPEDVGMEVLNFRIVRSDDELALQDRAGSVVTRAMEAAVAAIAVHEATENTVAAAAAAKLLTLDRDARWPSYMPFVSAGPSSARGHVSIEGRKCHQTVLCEEITEDSNLITDISNGTVVFLEMGASVAGYHAALMRTVWVSQDGGPPPAWLREAEKLIREAVDAMLSLMVPGTPACDLDFAAREILARRTFEAEMATASGYSIGIGQAPDWADKPRFALQAANKIPIRENMVFHLIPFLQTPWGAVGLSDTAVVTPSGGRILTTSEGRVAPPHVRVVIPECHTATEGW